VEVYIYDENLTLKGVIDEISSLIWTRRYWSAGEFKLLVPFTPVNVQLLVKYNLVMRRGDKEAAQIRYINIKKNAYGLEEIEVQGKFITHWLDHYVMMKRIVGKETSQTTLYRIVSENITNAADPDRRLPSLVPEQNPEDLGGGIRNYSSEPFASCLLAAESVAKAAKLGFVVETDVKALQHVFKVYKGRDMTADQNENAPCIFSQEFDNIFEQEYTNSVENLKTVCYVGGEILDGVEREIVQIGTASGLDRREIFINASDITRKYMDGETEKTMPLADYREALLNRGESELEQHAETLSFSSKINAFSNLEYKVDFDIGDRVTCLDRRWGIKINVRITEITESYQQSKQEIDVTFGESLPTLYDKLNKLKG
jgi:hypothetical protein